MSIVSELLGLVLQVQPTALYTLLLHNSGYSPILRGFWDDRFLSRSIISLTHSEKNQLDFLDMYY
jgi:hypothetical protein